MQEKRFMSIRKSYNNCAIHEANEIVEEKRSICFFTKKQYNKDENDNIHIFCLFMDSYFIRFLKMNIRSSVRKKERLHEQCKKSYHPSI